MGKFCLCSNNTRCCDSETAHHLWEGCSTVYHRLIAGEPGRILRRRLLRLAIINYGVRVGIDFVEIEIPRQRLKIFMR